MRSTISVIGVALAVLSAGCGKGTSAPTPVPQAITISGNVTLSNRNETSQLTAKVQMSDGSTSDVTAAATWTSSNAAVATVSSGGLVTALTNGTTTITASYQGKSSTAAATVAMRAAPRMTPSFTRLCAPYRAGMDVTISQTSGNMGMTVTSVTIIMVDINHVTRFSKTYSAAEIATLIGNNHLDASQTRVLSITTAYPGNVDTADSTGSVTITVTDDAGNAWTDTQSNLFQHDRC